MKKTIFLIFAVMLCLGFEAVFANSGSYIIKYKNDDNIYVISESLKNRITVQNSRAAKQRIEYIEPNYEVSLFNSKQSYNQNYFLIKAEYTAYTGCHGNGVKIGVIDSGIYNHSLFDGNICEGYNFIDETTDVSDDVGHGTFVCGIIGIGSSQEYATGVSQKAKIVPLKCFKKGYSTTVDIISKAITAAVDKYDCKVINMSFGLSSNSITLKNAINYALSKNVIIVAAVGNKGKTGLYYPAAYSGVIGVGSVNSQLVYSSFSQHNKSVDFTAPGENIKMKSISGYSENSGTSFSAPHVSAAAAIALSVTPNLTPPEFFNVLSQTSVDLGESGYDEYYGNGLINIEAMSNYLIEKNNFFISPVNFAENKPFIIVFNNTPSTVSVSLISADYEKSMLNHAEFKTVVLPYGERVVIENVYFGFNTKYFLWNGIIPLCTARDNSK